MLSNIKKGAIGFLIGVAVVLPAYFYVLGQLDAKETQNQLLTNLACGLSEQEFTQILSTLQAPEKFKEIAGDKHTEAWEAVKMQLFNQCYR
jgi:hypothetical protein